MRCLYSLGLFLALMSVPAAAQEQARTKSGEEVRLGWIGSVGADCKPNVPPTVVPTRLAQHGQIRLVQGTVKTQRAKDCGAAVLPVVVVFYTSSKGFKGVDEFALKTSDGGSERSYTVTVE